MDVFKQLASIYANRIADKKSPDSREKELESIFEEIDKSATGLDLFSRDKYVKNVYRELKKALFEKGFSITGLGLEKRGGLEWLTTESNSVGNEEAIELMRMVARGPSK